MRFFFATSILPLLLTPASSSDEAAHGGLRLRRRDSPLNARVLSTEHSMFRPLMCNEFLSVSDCIPTSLNYIGTLSTLLDSTPEDTQPVIPCGKCVVVDATDGSEISLPKGLNIEGMLHFPTTASLTLEATHVVVQGVLKMDPPALGNKVRIRMVGSEEQIFHPHDDNSMLCDSTDGCNVGKKAIVVAGGRLDIRGLEDDTCPTWTKLQSVVPPSGTATTSHEITLDDPKAAECWSTRPDDEILITNSKSSGGWHNQEVKTVQSGNGDTGTIDFGQTNPIDNPISLDDDPRMASEVAWLSRPIVFEAEGDGPSNDIHDALHGGHLIILHTPDVAQHIEGVEIRNFGQQGNLGRYPIHFHMSGSCAGSIVRKNVIRESKQRCVVIHGTHDVLVEENVSLDSYGHCYLLEDGGEHDNTFRNNLGARTRIQSLSIGSTDHLPATMWITNPMNHFIGNVCAGSQHMGIWFELRNIRGDSALLPENQPPHNKPNNFPLYTFRSNTAHSNNDKGMSTYDIGFRAPTEALFEGISSYHNRFGLMLHGTSNVRVKDAFFGMNENAGVLYFGNFIANQIEDSVFVGKCDTIGILLSLEPRSSQIEVYSSSFSGYTDGCNPGSYGAALQINLIQPKPIYDMPILSNLTFDSENSAHALAISSSPDKSIFVEDSDGTMNPSGLPGFFVNDADHMTTFIDSYCSPGLNGNGLFCENACLRRVLIDTGCCHQKFSAPENDYEMIVVSKTDPSKSFVFEKNAVSSGLWHNNRNFDVVLPLDDYTVFFESLADEEIYIPDVTLTFDDEIKGDDPPQCDHVTADNIEFACPPYYELATSDSTLCTLDPTYDDEEVNIQLGMGDLGGGMGMLGGGMGMLGAACAEGGAVCNYSEECCSMECLTDGVCSEMMI